MSQLILLFIVMSSVSVRSTDSSLNDVTIASVLRHPVGDQLANRTVAKQVETIARNMFGAELHVEKAVLAIENKQGPALLPTLMSMMQPKYLKLMDRVMTDNPKLRHDMPAITSTLFTVLQKFDSGKLRSVGDLFSTLESVPSIDAENLDMAKNVISSTFRKQPSDIGDILDTVITQKNALINKESNDPSTVLKASPNGVDLLQGLELIRPHLLGSFVEAVGNFSDRIESVAKIITNLETANDAKLWHELQVNIGKSFSVYTVLVSVGLTIVKESASEITRSITQLLQTLKTFAGLDAHSSAADYRAAVRNVAIAVRRLLVATLASSRNIAAQCDSDTPLGSKVALNGMAALLAGTMSALRTSSRILAARVPFVGDAKLEVHKVAASIGRAVKLLQEGANGFASDAVDVLKKSVNLSANDMKMTTDRAIDQVLKAFVKIGKLFAFK